jgi:archaellum component FlaC
LASDHHKSEDCKVSALEKMMESVVKTLVSTMGGDIDKLKSEVVTRVEAFEKNVQTLNDTLIAHHKALAAIEKDVRELHAKFDAFFGMNDSKKDHPPDDK